MKLKELLKESYKDGMSLEDIEKALESVELPKSNDAELERLRNAVSKANSEAADYKKKLNAQLSEEERKQAEKDQEMSDLKAQLETLQKDKLMAEHKAEFIALGYDDAMAADSAKALLNNDFGTLFKNQKTFLDGFEKQVESKLLQDTPRPGGTGTNPAVITKEQFDKMGYRDRLKVYEEQPQLYEQFTKE